MWPLPAKRPTTAANVSYESRNRGLRAFLRKLPQIRQRKLSGVPPERKGVVVQGAGMLHRTRLAELRRMYADAASDLQKVRQLYRQGLSDRFPFRPPGMRRTYPRSGTGGFRRGNASFGKLQPSGKEIVIKGFEVFLDKGRSRGILSMKPASETP